MVSKIASKDNIRRYHWRGETVLVDPRTSEGICRVMGFERSIYSQGDPENVIYTYDRIPRKDQKSCRAFLNGYDLLGSGVKINFEEEPKSARRGYSRCGRRKHRFHQWNIDTRTGRRLYEYLQYLDEFRGSQMQNELLRRLRLR